LTEKSVNDFRIGYAPTDWRELYSYLKASGFSDMEIEKAGLAKRTDKGYYDRFRGRIMFPINDSSGRVIAFSGRLFPDDEKSAKYLNSPETPLFSKSSVLFGIDKAKDSIRKNNFSILVEGQIDLVLSHQAGFKNTIASSGTAVSDVTLTKENIINNLGLVRRLSKNIVLAYDGDSAGVNAANRFAKVALSIGMDVKVASMEEGSDPADIISTQGADAWHKAVRESKHFIEFMLGKILKDAAGDGRKVGRGVRERLLPFVHDLESSIEKSHFISLISDRTGISEKALTEDLQKIESELKYEKDETYSARESAEKKLRKDPIERRLMGIAYWQASLSERAVDPELIFNKLSGVRAVYNEIKEDLIFEAEEFYLNSENLQKDVREMLSSIEEEYLNEEIVKKMIELRESKGEVEEIDILKKINEINKIKEDIKNSR
jgi:DNA primase